jgi:hypothetical protein
VTPHIAAPISSEFATQTAAAVTVTGIAVNEGITEAAANVIVAKAIISTAPTVAARLCSSRKKTAGKGGAC